MARASDRQRTRYPLSPIDPVKRRGDWAGRKPTNLPAVNWSRGEPGLSQLPSVGQGSRRSLPRPVCPLKQYRRQAATARPKTV